MSATQSVLHDLGIDPDLMMKDPDEFSRVCLEEAAKLAAVMDGSETPVAKQLRQLIDAASKINGKEKSERVGALFPAINDREWEQLELHELAQMVQALDWTKQVVLSYMEDRLNQGEALVVRSKKIAKHLYVKLRTIYELFQEMQKVFNSGKLYPPIPAKSGNYQDNQRIVAFFVGNEEYFNWRWVANRVLKVDSIQNEMELLEYVRNHPDCGVRILES